MKRLFYVLIAAFIFVQSLAAASISVPSNIKATLSEDNMWELTWDEPPEVCDKYYEIFGAASADVGIGNSLNTTTSCYYKDTTTVPGTLYNYKIRAFGTTTNASTNLADCPLIRTSPMPPAFSGISLIPQNSKILLNWITATAEPVTSYNIYRSVTPASSGFTQLATVLQNNGQYLDTGVINGKDYYYKIAGFMNNEGPMAASKTAAPFAAPFAPQNLSGAVSVSGEDIVLNWSVNNIRGTYDVSRLNIYDDLVSLTPVATPAGSVTTYTDAGAVKSEYHTYRITAEDVNGNTSMPAFVTVYMPDGSINTPSALAVTYVASNRVSFTWASSNDEDQITGFMVYRDGSPVAVTKPAAYTDTSVSTGATYEYWVNPFKGSDPEVTGCNAITVTVVPAAPVNLTLSQTGAGVLQLWWDNPVNEAASMYNVYRSTDGIVYDAPASITWGARTYIDSAGLTAGQLYFYKLAALKDASASPDSLTISARAVTAPVSPLDITFIGGTPYNGYVQLSWTAEADYDIRTYTVYCRADSAQNTVTTLSYTPEKYISGLTNGAGYTFWVTGTNALGSGDPGSALKCGLTPTSSPVIGIPQNLKITSGGDAKLNLSWDALNGAASYDIFRTIDPVSTADIFLNNVTSTAFTDEPLAGKDAWYRVRAKDAQDTAGADYSAINSNNAYTRPGAPENVELNNIAGGVLLSWAPPSGAYTYSPAVYRIFSSISLTDDFGDAIAETHTVYYADLKANTLAVTLYYRVQAVDSEGHSDTGTAYYSIDVDQPIDPPATLVARPGNERVTLNWKKVTPEYYNIYRSTVDGLFISPVAYNINFDNREYIDADPDIVNKTEYFYTIAAVTSGGEGPRSMTASAIPYAPPVIQRTPPVTCKKTTGKNIEITWPKAVSDTAGYEIAGYNIWRSRDNGWTYTHVSFTSYVLTDFSTYLDTGTQWDNKYTYLIKVQDAEGNNDTVYDPASIELPLPKNKVKLYANLVDLSRGQALKWQYVLVKTGRVKVNVYTLSGVFVKNLLDTEITAAASTLEPFESPEYSWDGTNDRGKKVASGVYLFIMELAGEKTIAKVAVVK